MKQQNAGLTERSTKSNNSQPSPEEQNQLSSRSVERPAVLDEVEELVKNTQMQLQQLRQEAEVHTQILQEFQRELEACSSSTENADSDDDEAMNIEYPEKDLQVESAPKEVKTKLPQPQDKDEDEKKDNGTEKLLNTDTIESNKNDVQSEEKVEDKQVDEKDIGEVQQVEKEQVISDKQARLATEKLMALKADIAKTLEDLQSTRVGAVELPVSGTRLQYRKQQEVQSNEQYRNRVTIDRPCRTKPTEPQTIDNVAEKPKDVVRNKHSKTELHKVQSSDSIDKVSLEETSDSNRHGKTKLQKAPSLENVNIENTDKVRCSKIKLDESVAKVSEVQPKDRHSKTKSYRSHTVERENEADIVRTGRSDLPGSVHHGRRSKRKHYKCNAFEVPPTPACSCSSLMNLEETPKLLPPEDQTSERHTSKSKGIQQVVMLHKKSQTTSNASVLHIKEEVKSTIQQVYNKKQLTVQQLPSVNIRRTLSVQKVPSVQIPPPGTGTYVSPRQNVAFWAMSQDGAVEVQKYGSSNNVNNNNMSTVNKEPQQQQQQQLTLPQWRDDFTETEMYTWFCEACRSVSEQNMNVPQSQYLSQCKECLRQFPTTELFQQHCIECQVIKKETRLDQCIKCLRSVPSIEIRNDHCMQCQSVGNVHFYVETSKTNYEKENNLQASQTEKVDLPEKEPEDSKNVSKLQKQRNVLSYAEQRKELQHDADSKKDVRPSSEKSFEPTPEYSINEYQIKGDIVSSLGEEEVMKELESYLTKEFPNIDLLDITGQVSDVSSLEEYFQSKDEDAECNLTDMELGELILNSLSARLQQQKVQSSDKLWAGAVNKVLCEHAPVTMVFRATEISEGSDHSNSKSPRSQRAKSAPAREIRSRQSPEHNGVKPTSNRESSDQGTSPFTHSKYHRHCFDSVIYPVEPVKIKYPPIRSKNTAAHKSPRQKKRSADSKKHGEPSRTKEKGSIPSAQIHSGHTEDVASKIEEEGSKNKLHPAADVESAQESSTEDRDKMTEESYEDDWEEESEHSAAEGAQHQVETGVQTDTAAPVAAERSQEIRRDRASSPVGSLRREMVTVDVQTSAVMISPPTSESLPPSEATVPDAAILIEKLQNACKCSPAADAAEQLTLPVVIGEKQLCSFANKVEFVCNCPTHAPESPKVMLVDKQTSTENANALVNTPTSPICPGEDELKMYCMSPSTCGTLHETVAKAAKGAQKMTNRTTSVEDNYSVPVNETVMLIEVHTSDESGDSAGTLQKCTRSTCPAKLGNTRLPQGCTCSSSTDDEGNKISGPCSRSSDDEMTSSTAATSYGHSEPVTSSTASGGLWSCCCAHGTMSQGEVRFDMQPSEGEVLAAGFNTSPEETLSADASEMVLSVVNFRNQKGGMQSNDDDYQSDGEISEGQVFLQ